jgi:cytochrome c oxidase subunit 2
MTLIDAAGGLLPSALLATFPAPTGDAGGGFWLPPQSSTVAGPTDAIFYLILWICVFFFVLIVALMALFVVKYRRREGGPPEKTASHNTPLELTWTIIPLILVIVIFYVGLKAYADVIQAPANAYEVWVTGQQWSWNFKHRNGAEDAKVLTVPAGRPVRLIMTSTDVLHALFIPAFRVKQDLVPGRDTFLWFETPDTGQRQYHQIFCAEYCGKEHSLMTATLLVLPPEEFEAEITAQANVLDDLPIEEYPKFFLERIYPRCQSCHRLDAAPNQGPGFWETHTLWGKERTLKDGRKVVVDEEYVRKSLLNPQGDVVAGMPGVMTTFQGQLSDKQIRVVQEFLKRAHEVIDSEGKRLP